MRKDKRWQMDNVKIYISHHPFGQGADPHGCAHKLLMIDGLDEARISAGMSCCSGAEFQDADFGR
jgi:hypothetical protein